MAVPKYTSKHSLRHPTFMMGICLLVLTPQLWDPSPGFTAMYRCLDESGSSVLTDNPAQLEDCSQLEPAIVSPQQVPNLTQSTASKNTVEVEVPQESSEHSGTSVSQESNHDHDITIPLKKIGGSFVVQVNLNKERTAHLIVDTGASMTVLSTQIAIDLGLLGTTDTELLTVNTAGGSVQVNMNYLASLDVGTAQAQHVAVAFHDLPDIPEQIEGLLGMSFLKNFLVTLDAEHARMILRPRPSS